MYTTKLENSYELIESLIGTDIWIRFQGEVIAENASKEEALKILRGRLKKGYSLLIFPDGDSISIFENDGQLKQCLLDWAKDFTENYERETNYFPFYENIIRNTIPVTCDLEEFDPLAHCFARELIKIN